MEAARKQGGRGLYDGCLELTSSRWWESPRRKQQPKGEGRRNRPEEWCPDAPQGGLALPSMRSKT